MSGQTRVTIGLLSRLFWLQAIVQKSALTPNLEIIVL
jgi:hypothetical protein